MPPLSITCSSAVAPMIAPCARRTLRPERMWRRGQCLLRLSLLVFVRATWISTAVVVKAWAAEGGGSQQPHRLLPSDPSSCMTARLKLHHHQRRHHRMALRLNQAHHLSQPASQHRPLAWCAVALAQYVPTSSRSSSFAVSLDVTLLLWIRSAARSASQSTTSA